MNKFQQHAADLVRAHGAEKALLIAEGSLLASSNTPNTYLYDEASWYLDKDGYLQLAKDQKKFDGVRDKRLKSNANFWLQVRNIIKKNNPA